MTKGWPNKQSVVQVSLEVEAVMIVLGWQFALWCSMVWCQVDWLVLHHMLV